MKHLVVYYYTMGIETDASCFILGSGRHGKLLLKEQPLI